VVDFAALPPEVNSARIYAGAGPGPLVAAAAAWDGLASELVSTATSYQGVLSELTSGSWLGPSSSAAAAAAAPYVSWISGTAAAAEQTADQARSAVAAYEAAFAATVPPPVIAANRTTLATLVATNILGQNTPAIAANEATYAEFWAQDATAMYGYAGASAAATQLTSFSAAPQTTNPSGLAAQSAATSQASGTSGLSQLVSQVPSTLQSLASSGAAIDPVTALEDFLSDPVVAGLGELLGVLGGDYETPLSGLLFVACVPGFILGPLLSLALPNLGVAGGLVSDVSGTGLGSTLAGSAESGLGSAGGAEVATEVGRAASVGGLSVPQAWGSAAPEIRLAAKALPLPGADGLPEAAPASPGFFGGMPPVGSVVNAPRNGQGRLRAGARVRVIPALVAAPGVHDDTAGAPRTHQRTEDASSGLSERELDELDQLRKELTELEMERDAAARLIKEAIRS
jgi:PPE-repeat protein